VAREVLREQRSVNDRGIASIDLVGRNFEKTAMMRRPRKPQTPKDRWAFLTRPGSEADLVREIAPVASEAIGCVVLAERRPRDLHHEPVIPAFAHKAMRTDGAKHRTDPTRIANALAKLLAELRDVPWALEIMAASPADRAAKQTADGLDAVIAGELDPKIPRGVADRFVDSVDAAEWIAQVWVVSVERALVGLTRKRDAILTPPPAAEGESQALAKSGQKLEEAFAWIGLSPGKGERCVDLGSGPGVWTEVISRQGAQVTAVDRARLKVALGDRKIDPAHASPFEYAPAETADWVFIHLAHRPFEVARLAAKWGRRAWASKLVANFLLPMKQKAEAVKEILAELEEAGWKGLRASQLAADGDEVTVFAWLDPRIAARGPQAPFKLRSAAHAEERGDKKSERGPRRAIKERLVPREGGDVRTGRPGRGEPRAEPRTGKVPRTGRAAARTMVPEGRPEGARAAFVAAKRDKAKKAKGGPIRGGRPGGAEAPRRPAPRSRTEDARAPRASWGGAKEDMEPRRARSAPRRDDEGFEPRRARSAPRRDDEGFEPRRARSAPRRDDEGFEPRRARSAPRRDDEGFEPRRARSAPRRDDEGFEPRRARSAPGRDEGVRHPAFGGGRASPRREKEGFEPRRARSAPRRDDEGFEPRRARSAPGRDDEGFEPRRARSAPRRDDEGFEPRRARSAPGRDEGVRHPAFGGGRATPRREKEGFEPRRQARPAPRDDGFGARRAPRAAPRGGRGPREGGPRGGARPRSSARPPRPRR